MQVGRKESRNIRRKLEQGKKEEISLAVEWRKGNRK